MKFRLSLFTLFLTFIALFFLNSTAAHAQITAKPTLYCAGSIKCVPSGSPTPTMTPSPKTTIDTKDTNRTVAEEGDPTTTISEEPCEETVSVTHNKRLKHKDYNGLFTWLLQWLLEFLNKLLERFGGSPINLPTNPSPTETPTQPDPTTGAEPTDSQPTTNPCITTAPITSITVAPSTAPIVSTAIYLGAAVEPDQLDDQAFSDALKKYKFNSLVAENVMKFDRLEPSRGQFTWDGADKIVNYAQANGMRVRGHALVWGRNNVPGWFTSLSNAEAEAAVENHIKTIVGRYKGKIAQWDVVNEAYNDDGSLDGGAFKEKLGDDFIEKSFKWAHEADPNAVLFYNDYSAESIGDDSGSKKAKSDAIFELAKKLKAQGLPVGVGLQTHVQGPYPGSEQTIGANIKRLKDAGIAVEITELDVIDADDQAARYAELGRACKNNGCTGVTTWGLYDGHSWRAGQAPLLLDESFNAKPAYNALLEAIGQ